MLSARRASTSSPVSSISMACLRLTLRDSATIGVEQNRPMLTPGAAKRAATAATASSQTATTWKAAAEATPSTQAIPGWGRAQIDTSQERGEGQECGRECRVRRQRQDH